jgi:formate dehydrogenase major subunit
VRFTLDGRNVMADAGETLIEVAERHGVQVPRLCH